MAATSLVNRIAIHATALTALPTLPSSAGTSITQAAWSSANFETISSRNRKSDDLDIGDSEWNINVDEVIHFTSAPLSDGDDEAILISRKVNPFEILCYDLSEKLITLDSGMTAASNVNQWTTSLTARAVAIEIYGLSLISFPKCIVTIVDIVMGQNEDQVAQALLRFHPLNASGTTGGMNIEHY